MRVIAGTARRLLLVTPKGNATRPTTDRIKETLFNILNPSLYDARFLDLFAGSGGIGIEALSRGAREAVFCDNSREALACIKQNLEHTKLAPRARVIEGDALNAIRKLSGKGVFDVVFLDPPYESDLTRRVLEMLISCEIVGEDSLVVAEALIDDDLSYAKALGYEIVREKEYKSNKHVFLHVANGGIDA